MNNFYQSSPHYPTNRKTENILGSHQVKSIGGLSRAHRIILNGQQREQAEEKLMSFAYKLGRSESQRNERRAKR